MHRNLTTLKVELAFLGNIWCRVLFFVFLLLWSTIEISIYANINDCIPNARAAPDKFYFSQHIPKGDLRSYKTELYFQEWQMYMQIMQQVTSVKLRESWHVLEQRLTTAADGKFTCPWTSACWWAITAHVQTHVLIPSRTGVMFFPPEYVNILVHLKILILL